MRYDVKLSLLVAALLLTGCSEPSGGPATPVFPSLLKSVPEETPIRVAANTANITWLEPTGAGKSWQEVETARAQVEEAIRASAPSLAAISYGTLSRPDFITYTRALKLEAKDFTGQPLDMEAFGTGQAGERWTLYTWQGPEIPQHPDRPLVHRWIRVYALYNMDAANITLLFATIRGEVYE